ncbi:GNAT family N-acetyltransferase [Brachybacterium vulturis]|uniref:GNAT family N-acetyltransferase n=1 Tax=Brachybacterium vulturis TaxID=2017484 RepID=UPI003735F926
MHDGAVIPSPDGDRRAVVMPGPAPLALRTPRLHLTPVAERELEELLALHADPRAFAEDLTEPLTDRAQMRWVLRRWRESWVEHEVGYLSVRAHRPSAAAATDELPAAMRSPDAAMPGELVPLPGGLLGVVGLTPLAAEDPTVLSAYWRLSPAATGRGVASEAMRAVLTHPQLGGRAGGSCGGDRGGGRSGTEIVAVTAAANRPSLALACRLGFVPAPPERPVPGGRAGDVLLVLGGS